MDLCPLCAGCLIQNRMLSSLILPPERFALVNTLALARVNIVTLAPSLSFLLRAVDFFLMTESRRGYFASLLWLCPPDEPWFVSVCVWRWVPIVLPILSVLYIMRNKGEGGALVAGRGGDSRPSVFYSAARGGNINHNTGGAYGGVSPHGYSYQYPRPKAAPEEMPGQGLLYQQSAQGKAEPRSRTVSWNG
jgi:hypothetical protein